MNFVPNTAPPPRLHPLLIVSVNCGSRKHQTRGSCYPCYWSVVSPSPSLCVLSFSHRHRCIALGWRKCHCHNWHRQQRPCRRRNAWSVLSLDEPPPRPACRRDEAPLLSRRDEALLLRIARPPHVRTSRRPGLRRGSTRRDLRPGDQGGRGRQSQAARGSGHGSRHGRRRRMPLFPRNAPVRRAQLRLAPRQRTRAPPARLLAPAAAPAAK